MTDETVTLTADVLEAPQALPALHLWRLGIIVLSVCLCAVPATAGQTIRIGIGHQSFCTDTYAGGIVVKGLQLLEKYLPREGKYKDVTYDIVWEDYTSGPPITNQMLAGKLDIGVMGDYPLLVNGARFQETRSLRTLLVTMTGYNIKGGVVTCWGMVGAVPETTPQTSR